MKFFTSIVVLALSASVQAACSLGGITGTDTRCCWGGDQGTDACLRQNGYVGCTNGREDGNFCVNNGVPNSKCNADCCDIATGRGQPCPKGKNRCDPDSGCPYRKFPEGTLV